MLRKYSVRIPTASSIISIKISRLPHFLDNMLTDGGEVVTLMYRSPFTPRKVPGTHFY
jgi:hypothetical protein